MKTIFYVLIALFMTSTFTACTADNLADADGTEIEEVSTTGENGHVEPEDEGGA